MFYTQNECQEWIENVRKFGDKLDLKRMNLACEKLNHPELKLKTIHIAGTNGKGSTTAFLKSMLMEHGYSVGTFTSPYIVDFNERITLNNQMISSDDLIKHTNTIYDIYINIEKEHNERITFFEILTLISFLYFNEKQPDFVIYEVGLGGRLDSTNVIIPVVCGITNISYDHMHILGDTLEKIATEKLGIVKEGIPLITTETNATLQELFQRKTIEKNSELIILDPDNISNISIKDVTNFTYQKVDYQLGLLGVHQTKNAILAIEIIRELDKQNYLNINQDLVKNGLLNTFWPGRFEVFGNIVLDGAHNVAGVNVLKETVLNKYPGKEIISLTCIMDNKEKSKVISIIESFSAEIFFTSFDYYRTTSAKALYELSNHPYKFYYEDYYEVLQYLQEKYTNKNTVIVITGSLYFISIIRNKLKNEVSD